MIKYTKDLVYIILGSDNPSYDGLGIGESHDNSHIKSIKVIAELLRCNGFEIGNFDERVAEEAAFDLVKSGHIVFFNAAPIAYLKIPKEISKKQYAILEILEEELREYDLYVQHLDPVSLEAFLSKFHEKDFVLKKKDFKLKDRD